jgi:Arc/MetJ-type ribon-helix-helix transcriptional regulator
MKPLGRPPLAIPTTRISVNLPVHLADWLREKATDPVTEKLRYGAVSDYLISLIRKDKREKEIQNG